MLSEIENKGESESSGKIDLKQLLIKVIAGLDFKAQSCMKFKYKLQGDKFIITFLEGKFLSQIDIPFQGSMREELSKILENDAEQHKEQYKHAWNGEEVVYETFIQDTPVLTFLHPVKSCNHVIEVEGATLVNAG